MAQESSTTCEADETLSPLCYLKENPKSLCAEFPEADPQFVTGCWEESNNDCEVARKKIRSHLGLPEVSADGETNAMTASGGFSLTEEVGDLFESDSTACLAHCVSRDLKMGKGIALPFKKRFGRVDELRAQQTEVGGCAILQEGSRFIYYMVTKDRYFHKPTYDAVYESLQYMKNHMVANGMTKLCIPRIACGLDGLEWTGKEGSGVKEMIANVFQDTNISITVYRL